jgi:hypothetical protein
LGSPPGSVRRRVARAPSQARMGEITERFQRTARIEQRDPSSVACPPAPSAARPRSASRRSLRARAAAKPSPRRARYHSRTRRSRCHRAVRGPLRSGGQSRQVRLAPWPRSRPAERSAAGRRAARPGDRPIALMKASMKLPQRSIIAWAKIRRRPSQDLVRRVEFANPLQRLQSSMILRRHPRALSPYPALPPAPTAAGLRRAPDSCRLSR